MTMGEPLPEAFCFIFDICPLFIKFLDDRNGVVTQHDSLVVVGTTKPILGHLLLRQSCICHDWQTNKRPGIREVVPPVLSYYQACTWSLIGTSIMHLS